MRATMRSLACGVLAAGLLVGCGLPTDQIGERVKILMQKKFDSDPQFKEWLLYVTRVQVLKQSENRYLGMATVMYKEEPHDIPVEITVDGSKVMWLIQPGGLMFITQSLLKAASERPPTMKPSAPTQAAAQTDAEQQPVEAPRKAEMQAAPTPGRIGESRAQIYARYGKPQQLVDGVAVFLKGDFVIAVSFFQEKADALMFTKLPKDVLGRWNEMSDNEIQTLLQACGGERKWECYGMHRWQTEDVTLFAFYNDLDNMLGVLSKAHLERSALEKKSEEEKKLQGF